MRKLSGLVCTAIAVLVLASSCTWGLYEKTLTGAGGNIDYGSNSFSVYCNEEGMVFDFVQLDLNGLWHERAGDIIIRLIAPDATEYIISSNGINNGYYDSDDDFSGDYTFSSYSSSVLGDYNYDSIIDPGTYKVVEDSENNTVYETVDNMAGENIKGTWTVLIEDLNDNGSIGSLVGFTLTFSY